MSDNNNLVSVIVPVYKVENYLRDCLDSIVNQTYKNLEIILVDDGSPDQSGAICEEYACKDPRITVYHKENGGLSDARNYALDRCNGDYITFVDSDDILRNDFTAALFRIIKESKSDIAISSVQKIPENMQFAQVNNQTNFNVENIKVYSPHEALKMLLYQREIGTGGPYKLYKRKLFDKIRYPFGLYYEDLATTYKIFFECNNIALTQEKMYIYRQRQDSILHQHYSPKLLSCIQVSRQLYQNISAKFPDLEKAAASRAFSVNRAIYLQLPHDKKDERKQVWQEMKKYRRTVIFDSQARKRERLAALLSYSGSKIFHLFAYLYKKWQMRS